MKLGLTIQTISAKALKTFLVRPPPIIKKDIDNKLTCVELNYRKGIDLPSAGKQLVLGVYILQIIQDNNSSSG